MAGPDLVGKVLDGRYRVESRLGAGGMATVYLAWQETLQRKVVVKVPDAVLLTEERFRRRFRREVRSLTDLRHPHVVTVLESGEWEGTPYAVIEYLPGGSLKDRLLEKVDRGEPETPAEILEWLHPIARTLDFIHSENVVHRDVKPGNILFDKSGNPFLSDFGIAKALTPESTELTLRTGSPGTPGFVPPEILDNLILPAFDQYSLGATVFCALVNRAPKTLEAASGLHEPLGSRIPAPAVEVLEKALSASPTERFPSCTEFAAAFEEALKTASDGPTPEHADPEVPLVAEIVDAPETSTYAVPGRESPAADEPGRRRWWLPAAGAVLLAAVIVAIVLLGGGGEDRGGAASPGPDLKLGISGPSSAYCGEEITWKITARNAGAETIDAVSVEAGIPRGFRLLGSKGEQDLPLEPGESRTLLVTALATTKGEGFTFTAKARGAGLEVTESAVLSVVGPTLSVTMGCEGSAEVRSVGRATIAVGNVGSVPAFGVRVVDTLPAGMTVERVDEGGKAAGGDVTWDDIGDLAPGASKTVVFGYRLERVGQLVNRVSVADRYRSAGCAGECEVFVVGPPGVQAEVVDAVAGNLDADAFPEGSEYYYVASLLNQGGLPIQVNLGITFSEEIERTGMVGETNSTGSLVPVAPLEKGEEIDGVTYEFRVWLEPGERKFLRIPVRALRASQSRAARLDLRIRWDVLHPETGARTRHHGELEVGETTWITGG